MNERIRQEIYNLYSKDWQLQFQSFESILAQTDHPVNWAYQVWDELVAALKDKDNHVRAIAAQVMCNLAKSDPENRMVKDVDILLEVTRDERFVTARHCLQALWKVGLAGEMQRHKLVDGLARRFQECITEKNGSLTRSDILQSLGDIYTHVGDETLREKALELIETEDDPKYRQKYAALWRKIESKSKAASTH